MLEFCRQARNIFFPFFNARCDGGAPATHNGTPPRRCEREAVDLQHSARRRTPRHPHPASVGASFTLCESGVTLARETPALSQLTHTCMPAIPRIPPHLPAQQLARVTLIQSTPCNPSRAATASCSRYEGSDAGGASLCTSAASRRWLSRASSSCCLMMIIIASEGEGLSPPSPTCETDSNRERGEVRPLGAVTSTTCPPGAAASTPSWLAII